MPCSLEPTPNGVLLAMDLVKLGVVIDPTGAETGARKAIAAAKEMEKEVPKALDKVEKAEKKAGEAAKKMGEETRKGAQAAEQAVAKVAGSPSFDRLRNRATQTMAAVRASMQVTPGNTWDRVRQMAERAGQGISTAFNRARTAAVSSLTTISSTAGRVFGGGMSAATRTLSMFTSGITRATGAVRSFVPAVSSMAMPLGKLAGLIGGAYLAFQALGGIANGIGEGSGLAGEVGRATVAMEALTESAQVAESMVKRLRETSKAGGTSLTGSLDAVGKYVALGFSPADAVKLDKNLADIAGSLGLSAARANEVAVALVQVKAQGTVAITELRDQIAEKGVPIMSELAKKLGVTQAALKDMVSEGKVDAKSLIDIFLNMEGGFAKFQGGVMRATQTMPGALARLKANFADTFGVELFTPINQALIPLVNRVATAIGKMGATARTVGATIGSALTAMLDPVVSGLEAVSDWLVRIQPQLDAFVAVVNQPGGFKLALDAGIDTAMDLLRRGMEAAGMVFESIMTRASYEIMKMMQRMTEASFWQGLADALYNAAVEFVNVIKGGITNILLSLHEAHQVMGRSIYAGAVNAIVDTPDMKAKTPSGPAAIGAAPEIMSFGDAWSKTQERLTVPQVKFGQAMADQLAKGTPGEKPLAALPTTAPGEDAAAKAVQKATDKVKKGTDELAQAARRYIEATMTPMEKFKATQAEIQMLLEKGKLTQEQANRAMNAAEKERIELEKQQGTELQKLMKQWADLKTVVMEAEAEIAGSFSVQITTGLTDMITGAKSASDAFNDMAKSIVNDLTRIATQMLVNWAIQKAIGFAVGAFTGGAGTATATASTAAVAHTGGVVSHQMPNSRTMTTTSFAQAPRYQHGGMVGVSSGEVPAVMEPGEQVLTRDNAQDISNRLNSGSGGGKDAPAAQAVTIINVTDPTAIDAHLMQNPNAIFNAIGKNPTKIRRMLGIGDRVS